MIAFLRLVHNPADEASLDRVINVPPRGIGDKTLITLHNVARQNNIQPGFVLLDLARGARFALLALVCRPRCPSPLQILAGCLPTGAPRLLP